MHILALILVTLVALEHLYILVLEMFLWRTERARRIFGVSAALSEQTVTMAANQGLYNGFLAAGLIWGLVSGRADVMVFFLACVVVAGLYGAATVSPPHRRGAGASGSAGTGGRAAVVAPACP